MNTRSTLAIALLGCAAAGCGDDPGAVTTAVGATSSSGAVGSGGAATTSSGTGSGGSGGGDGGSGGVCSQGADGFRGLATATLLLPAEPGEGIYFPDLQGSFPDVDWGSLERLYIPAGNEDAPFSFSDNTWDSELDFLNQLPTGVGTEGNISGTGNVRAEVPEILFADFMGWPAGTDLFLVEAWTDVSGPLGGAAVAYQPGDYVMHDGDLYECIASSPVSGLLPTEHPEAWQLLPKPNDDVRLAPGSPHAGRGLLDSL